MARRKQAHGGGHGWFVTFADLMGLLVSFFVMLVAFSSQDAKKVQVATGSMRDAFGVQKAANYSGVVEGTACRPAPKSKTLHASTPRIHPLRRRRTRKVRISSTTMLSPWLRLRCAGRWKACRS
jgi:flagellar motor protein MotB